MFHTMAKQLKIMSTWALLLTEKTLRSAEEQLGKKVQGNFMDITQKEFR